MTTDTPSSRDEEIPTPRTDAEAGTRYVVPADFARQLERDLIRLSAEREKERSEYDQEIEDNVRTVRCLRATLAERDNQLAEVKAKNSGLLTSLANVENRLEIYEKDRGHHLTEANDLKTQLLAAQAVNGKKDKALAIALSVIQECDPDTVRQYAPIIKEAMTLSPDPTLLDEVARVVDELLGAMHRYARDVDDSPTIEHRSMCHRAEKLLSRLRQSTRETEEKV